MSKEYLDEMALEMANTLAALEAKLATVRTGRASPALLTGVQVDVSSYGAVMPLNQLATVSVSDARLLVVSPWDKSTLTDIEKAIGSAGLGLNPSSDGQVIRVPIPALTGERRKDLTRAARGYAEDHRIRARAVRKEYNDLFKGMETDKEISQDELNRLLKLVQEKTDETIARIDEIVKAKETEILEV